MRTSSAKAKGRRLSALFAARLRQALRCEEGDVFVTPSGVTGPDVILSPLAQKLFPFAVECKNQEALNLWSAMKQAVTHVKPGQIPLLVYARNNTKPWVAMPMEDFFEHFYPCTKEGESGDTGEPQADPGVPVLSVRT